jgi:hypothetical protein
MDVMPPEASKELESSNDAEAFMEERPIDTCFLTDPCFRSILAQYYKERKALRASLQNEKLVCISNGID